MVIKMFMKNFWKKLGNMDYCVVMGYTILK